MVNIRIALTLLLVVPLYCRAQKAPPKNLPVIVDVLIVEKPHEKHLILYSYDRPLVISDFRGRPDASSNGVAATYSGIQMELKASVKNNSMELSVALTIYFDPSKSWAKKEGKNARVLAHEQNHFDLTAIKACQLAKAIITAPYKSHNAMEQVRELQRKFTRELNDLQVQYDRETRHGIKEEVQAQWAERIEKDLKEVACF